MELLIIIVLSIFALLLFAMVVVSLINAIDDMRENKKRFKKENTIQYILEVKDGGEIELRKMKRGGGINRKLY